MIQFPSMYQGKGTADTHDSLQFINEVKIINTKTK